MQSLAEYLTQADHKYTAESKVADLVTLKQFLRDRIEIESKLVDMHTEGTSALLGSMKVTCGGVNKDAFSEWMRSRNELLDAVIQQESVVKKIKAAFHQQNTNRPPNDRFPPPSSVEIRQKLRERSGAPAAVAAGVAVPTPENWHVRKAELQHLIQKRLLLVARMEAAEENLLKMRESEPKYEALDDAFSSAMVSEVPPSTLLCLENFDR
jgi:hypothetical protein